ncbi:hypothetical protein ABWI00_21915 [Algihabitans albus]|uniref:hypothetical protein n=1 Tax=Algihabitans albus TaxID=2164067 RepID=UPI0035D065E8
MRVPRVTEQQVRITPLPNPRQRLSVSADTFGAQRARRLSQTAEGVADLGDDLGGIALDQVRRRRRAEQAELDQLALRSEADAEQGFARWQSAATDTLAGFQSLQGMDAVGTYQAALAELAGLETRIGEEIGDAAARALFAQQVTRRLPDFQASLARHHEAQLRAYRATAAETRIQSAIGAALTNPDLMSGALAEIAAVSAQQGEALDLPAEALAGTVAETVRGQTSRIHFGRVEQLLSQGQSAAALAHLEDYGGQMTKADRAQLELKAAEAARRDEVLAGYRAIATGGELPASLRRAPQAPGEVPDSPERPGPVETGDLPDATRADAVQALGLSPRLLRAQAAATAQAEDLAGSPQAGLHGGYLAQLDRLATAGLTDPGVQGQIAELLTADYEAEVAALSEAKATALQEVYRGLRDGGYRPASLPPDLAVLLSEAERAEIEAWWQGGLAVAPDAALFEGLIALPPDALLALDLSRPALARHLSKSETARLQSLQAELRRQRGRAPAEGGDGIGGEAEGREAGGGAGGGSDTLGAPLTELNATLQALDVGAGGGTASDGAMNETALDLWGVNRRRVGVLPDDEDPRETQVAVGIFGDDEDGGEDGGGEGEEEREDATGTPAQDASPETEAPPASAEEENAAAEALADLIERASDLSGLSEQEIEALGREALKLIPVVGAPLSYQDGVEALSQARRALEDEDYWAALQAAGEGLIELGSIVPGVGQAARGAKAVGRTVGRAALNLLDRLRQTRRGSDLGGVSGPGGPTARMPEGSFARVRTNSGAEANVKTSGQRLDSIERLKSAMSHVKPSDDASVAGLINDGRLYIDPRAGEEVVNILRGGGAPAADAAFERIVREQGGSLDDVMTRPNGARTFTSGDGTTYTRRLSTVSNGETVSVIVVAPGANRKDKFEFKVRFDGEGLAR